MDLTTKLADLKVKADPAKKGIISGYASTFNNIDSYGDTIAPGAFKESLNKHLQDGTKVPLLFEHSRALDSHVGELIEAKEDAQGLHIKASIDLDSESGSKAHKLVENGRIKGLSIGFFATDVEPDEIDGRPVNRIKSIDLKEVSLVLTPADAHALIGNAKTSSPGHFITKSDAADIVTALDAGDDGRSLEELSEKKLREEKLAKFRSSIIKGDDTAARQARRGLKGSMVPELKEIIKGIVNDAAASDRDLTVPETRAVKLAQSHIQLEHHYEQSRELWKKFEGFTPTGETTTTRQESPNMDTKTQLPTTDQTRTRFARTAVKAMSGNNDLWSEKSIPTSGEVLVPAMTSTDIHKTPAPALSILELIPHEQVLSPQFSYLRQTARVNNAAVVAPGEVKPTSEYGFERVDAALQVVAHLAKGIDKYLLSDIAALNSFLASEMVAGVMEKVEGLIVEAIDSAEGAQLQAFTTDLFGTTRSGLTTLQSAGLTPAAFILSPEDWQTIEMSKTSGSGQFIFGSTPVNQIEKTLWSVPAVVSPGVEKGSGYLIAQDTVKLFSDGNVETAWNSSGEDFSKNRITFRVEGRFKPVVTRGAGVVKLDLTAE